LKKAYCFFVFMCSIGLLHGQISTDSVKKSRSALVRTFQRLLGEHQAPGKPRLLIYPTLAYTPETSWEIGLSGLLLFHAQNDEKNSRLSEVQSFTFLTLNEQYGIWLDHAIYTAHNNWFLLGRWRWQQFPLLYYGIGPEAPKSNPAVVSGAQTLFRQRGLRKIKGNLFGGPQVDWQSWPQPRFEGENGVIGLPVGGKGSSNLGLGASLVYDTRENVLNVRQGAFAELSWLRYGQDLGSNFNFSTYSLDLRGFLRMKNPQQTLALQAFLQTQTGQVPFNQLSMLGGDGLMRGYYLGRFRDRAYAALQAEYRFLPFPFSKRFGATAFASAGAVAPSLGALRFHHLKPAAGLGLRYLIFPGKDIFVRIDFALTPEGNGFYFYNGEAF
jgi:Omp85 superfamily domain